MQIYFKRTGGFAGITSTVEIDTDDLPPDEARTVEEMVGRLDFFNLPSRFAPPRSGADRFQYEIVVRQAGKEHTVRTTDAVGPPELQRLVEYLSARRGRRGSSQQGGGAHDR